MTLGLQVVVGLLSICLFVLCDYTITRWAELLQPDGFWTWRLLFTIILAPLAMLAFGLVGARTGLAAVSGFVNTGIVVGGVLVGALMRGEQLTVYQKIGLVFGLLAMLLLNLGKADAESPPPAYGTAQQTELSS
jgi:drug/metabolite transporter (DMT)-like permease